MSELTAELAAAVTHPGSRTDAAARAEGQEAPPAVPPIPEPASLASVPVRLVAAEEGIYRTMALQASGARQLLPQDPGRARAVVIAVDNPVVLCATKELAQDAANQASNVPYPTGLYLPVGLPLVILSKGLVWAASTSTAAASRISVLVEHEDPGA